MYECECGCGQQFSVLIPRFTGEIEYPLEWLSIQCYAELFGKLPFGRWLLGFSLFLAGVVIGKYGLQTQR